MSAPGPDWSRISAFARPEDSPGFVLWRDFMRWQRGLNARLRPLDLTQPQFAVLAVCGWLTREDGEVTQRDVVEFLDMDRMHVSQIASRLEAKGLLQRDAAAADQRAKRVSLTPRAKALLAAAVPVVEAFDRDFFGT